jgi:predicted metal-dependent hydrolase
VTEANLFGSLLTFLRPSRQAKSMPGQRVTKPAAPAVQLIDMVLDGQTVRVHVHRKKQARNYTLSPARDGTSVRLTLPLRASIASGLDFVREKQALVLTWLAAKEQAVVLAPGHVIAFKGVAHAIMWQADFPRGVVCANREIRVGGPQEMAAKRVRRWLRQQALDDLTRTTVAVAAAHQLRVTKIAVNNASARWGSCSSTGAINYSWRLIFAPDAARHYVVCHELAHLAHMNHSVKFWAEVERLGGDLTQRAWFKTEGPKVLAV